MFLTKLINSLFKKTTENNDAVKVESEPFEHFLIDIDECTFLANTDLSTEENTYSPTAGFWKRFDTYQPTEKNVTQIAIVKEIGNRNYKFISHPINIDKEALRSNIILGQSSVVYYNKYDPTQYHFVI